jgi:flagellar assembly protein FliH
VGSILKENLVAGLGAKLSHFNLTDVETEASRIRQQAIAQADQIKAQADELLRQTQLKAKTILENAQKDGFQKGYTEGLEEGKKQGSEQAYLDTCEQAKKDFSEQSQQIRNLLTAVFGSFDNERDQFIAQAQQELLTLALALAVRITHRQIELDPQVVLENVKSAIDLVSSRSEVVLKINPADIDRFKLLDNGNSNQLFSTRHVKIVADDSIASGGCIVKTENTTVDAQIATQIDNIVRQLAPACAETIAQWSEPAGETQNTTSEEASTES